MKKIPLYSMAHARSGDKGEGSNVGILAYDERGYEILREWLTTDRVKTHFGEIVKGVCPGRQTVGDAELRCGNGGRRAQKNRPTEK